MKNSGTRIKRRRTDLQMTMEQLAEKTGYTSPSKKTIIYQIESGKSEVTYSRLSAFATALETNIYYLLGLSDRADITDQEILSLIEEKYSNK